jgi:uncharacterized protein (TIGR00255 family)
LGTKASEIHSMTGFGRGAAAGSRFRATVELRTVNGRFLDIRAKLPRTLIFLEPQLREALERSLKRGVIDLSVTLQALEPSLSSQFDAALARTYAERAGALAKDLGLNAGLTGLDLLKLPGVMGAENPALFENEPEVPKMVGKALDEALGSLLEMRRQEGDKLTKVLQRELAEIRSHREWIHRHREELNARYAKKIRSRFVEWTEKGKSSIDEGRFYQEVAFYLDRSDVTEELDRLASHLKQCEDTLASRHGKSIGKRLEFLAQEIGREVNTIGAKSDQAQVTNHVVEMKLTLEKIREQVQNLE